MILNLDFNPYINKICKVDLINLGKENKSNFSTYIPGGSIIISNFLGAFGEKSLITGFLGGLNGERYHRIIFEKGLNHEFISIKDETKIKLDIIDKRLNETSVLDKEPRVTRDDVKQFLVLYLELIINADLICGTSDTLPTGLSSNIYFKLIKIANKNKKKFILQASGEVLKIAIDASPYMVVLDKEMLEYLTNIDFENEKEIIQGSNYILQKGVEFVVICMDDGGVLLLGQSKGYKIIGDGQLNTNDLRKVVAAFALGISRDYDLDMTLRLAYAFNNYKNPDLTDEIDISEIKKMMAQADISTLEYI